jgi:hypothetical protein
MQYLFTSTKVNHKDSRDQNANQCKMDNILYFQYKKNETRTGVDRLASVV